MQKHTSSSRGGSMKNFANTFRTLVFGLALVLFSGWETLLAQVTVTIPSMSVLPGATITIPVNVGDLAGQNVTAFEFEAVCDSAIIRFTGVESSGTLSA